MVSKPNKRQASWRRVNVKYSDLTVKSRSKYAIQQNRNTCQKKQLRHEKSRFNHHDSECMA